MFDYRLKKLAHFLQENNFTVATAESCTGGLLSSRFTDISGSSVFVKLNFVTYANEAKKDILNVPEDILSSVGAVSEECAYHMALGLHNRSGCNLAICTTGIAGPTGGTKEKPVGLVFVSVFFNNKITVQKFLLPKFLPRKLMKYIFSQKAIDLAYNVIFSDKNHV